MVSRRQAAWIVFAAAILVAVAAVSPATASAKGWRVARTPKVNTLKVSGVVSSISCPSTKQCWAAGPGILHSSDGGKRWSKQTADAFDNVSCVTSQDCWATAGNYAGPGESELGHTTDGGRKWSVTALSDIGYVRGITCPTTTTCFAPGVRRPKGDSGLLVTSDGGKSWSVTAAPAIGILSCLTAKDCFAAGSGAVLHTTNGAKSWTHQKVPSAKHDDLQAVACATKSFCVAVGQDPVSLDSVIITTSDGGTKWKARRAPKRSAGLTAVACPTTRNCWAVGTDEASPLKAYIDATTDGGKHWSIQKSYGDKATGGTLLGSVACTTAKRCVAGGSPGETNDHTFIVYTTDGG
jgi:photosystem II stability/assembly factor-like uncharacterized protein